VWLLGELKRAIVHLSFISSVGTGWEDTEHISKPRATRLSVDCGEGVRGEINESERETETGGLV
jgi:hypothetical protein